MITKESEVHVAGESLNNVFEDDNEVEAIELNILIEPEKKRFLESKPLKTNTAARKNVKSVAPLKLDQKERNSSNINVEEILYIDYQEINVNRK